MGLTSTLDTMFQIIEIARDLGKEPLVGQNQVGVDPCPSGKIQRRYQVSCRT